jgi:hypothetical protein
MTAAALDGLIADIATPSARIAIRADANFLAATRKLVGTLAALESETARVDFLHALAERLGDAWYAAFIKLLTVVGESDDPPAKQLIVDTLAYAMQRGDAPSGSLSSWGIPYEMLSRAAELGASFFRSAPRRNLDPIEYITAWYCQSTYLAKLPEKVYRDTLVILLELFDVSHEAARVYRSKLSSDAVNQPDGIFTQATRTRLMAIAAGWEAGLPHQEIAGQVAHRDRVPVAARIG